MVGNRCYEGNKRFCGRERRVAEVGLWRILSHEHFEQRAWFVMEDT